MRKAESSGAPGATSQNLWWKIFLPKHIHRLFPIVGTFKRTVCLAWNRLSIAVAKFETVDFEEIASHLHQLYRVRRLHHQEDRLLSRIVDGELLQAFPPFCDENNKCSVIYDLLFWSWRVTLLPWNVQKYLHPWKRFPVSCPRWMINSAAAFDPLGAGTIDFLLHRLIICQRMKRLDVFEQMLSPGQTLVPIDTVDISDNRKGKRVQSMLVANRWNHSIELLFKKELMLYITNFDTLESTANKLSLTKTQNKRSKLV